jgi:hypothetical protein
MINVNYISRTGFSHLRSLQDPPGQYHQFHGYIPLSLEPSRCPVKAHRHSFLALITSRLITLADLNILSRSPLMSFSVRAISTASRPAFLECRTPGKLPLCWDITMCGMFCEILEIKDLRVIGLCIPWSCITFLHVSTSTVIMHSPDSTISFRWSKNSISAAIKSVDSFASLHELCLSQAWTCFHQHLVLVQLLRYTDISGKEIILG